MISLALLIDMDNREITISTCGIAIRYLTDSRIDNILDAAYAKISNGDYNGCMHSMLTGVETYYEKGISEGQYNYDSETGKISRYHVLTLGEIFGVLAVAIGAGCIIYFTISNSYKVRGKGYYYAYQQNSKVNLRVKEDRLVNQTTTHHRISTSSGSSGGHSSSHSGRSTTHTSSSGRSHGGGSRKF